MPMERRTFLVLSAATAIGASASLLGAGQALAAGAPATTYPVGVRRYNWYRGSRPCTTYVYYPAAIGTPGGSPVTNAPIAAGVFPVSNFTHGYSSSPQNSLFLIRPLAAAGFIVAAPYFSYSTFNDVYNGNYSKDVSEILTQTLALNSGSDPLAGHLDTSVGVGVSGHSMGGMTTLGLLTSWPDSRITTAIPMSTVDMGTPSGSVHAKTMFIHGDHDTTCAYSSARTAYSKIAPPKGFLTFIGGTHTSYWSDNRFPKTSVDWMRWGLYGDTAARDRLASDASGSSTKWEFLGDSGGGGTTTYVRLRNAQTGLYVDGEGRTSNGSYAGQHGDSTSTNQQWSIEADGSYVRIKNRATGLYLDGLSATTNGSAAGQWSDTNSTNQQWTQASSGSTVRFRNRATGLYLDGMGRTSNDADLGQYSDTGSTNQQWTTVNV